MTLTEIRVYTEVGGKDPPPTSTPFYRVRVDLEIAVELGELLDHAEHYIHYRLRDKTTYYWFKSNAKLIAFKFRFHNNIV